MNEFSLIETYFAPLSRDGLKDDAALVDIPAGCELVVTSDTLNEGTHFVVGAAPEDIAHKALRVNLSDLASMGAQPLCYQLNIAYPRKPEARWLKAFTNALAADQAEFNVYCSGGDTTGILGDYLSISITALGCVPKGAALKRSHAKAGDAIFVTGPVGAAYLGFRALHNDWKYSQALLRYRRPVPRLNVAAVRGHVHAAADISDGLLADLEHIASASNLGAEIHLDAFVFDAELEAAFAAGHITRTQAVTGGDDYELILTCAPDAVETLKAQFPAGFVIGTMQIGAGVTLWDAQGQPVICENLGWSHF